MNLYLNAMKIILISITIIALNAKYANGISCYVCHSLNHIHCQQTPQQYVKSCGAVEKERYQRFDAVLKMKNKTTTARNDSLPIIPFTSQCLFCERYQNGSNATQCVKTIMNFKNGAQRVIRDCGGLVSKGHGCDKTVSSDGRVTSLVCYCDEDNCNSRHRRIKDNNIWINIFLLSLISGFNYFTF